MTNGQASRRRFLKSAAVLSTSMATAKLGRASIGRLTRPIRLGLISDLHHDVMHDGPQRLEAFLQRMQANKPDALLQLGDFAYPNEKNQHVTSRFNEAHERSLHVLGNHEIDDGHSFEEVAQLWGMKGRYYVETIDGLHIVVLDGNEKPENHQGGYPSHIGEEQLEWLRRQLADLDGPVVVFCHQPLAGPSCVDNSAAVQAVLDEGAEKVLLTVNGHTHIDHVERAGRIINLHINSASYYWVGGEHRHASYAPDVHAAYPYIEYTCPYKAALFTLLTIDPTTGRIHLAGSDSQWMGKSPAEVGRDKDPHLVDGEEICPRIRPRRLFPPG